MADGNVGSLFMTLGLKDEISIGLDKVTKKLSSAQKYTDDLQKEVGNLRKELKSASGTDISGPFKKSLEFIKKYDDGIYNAIVRTNRLAYALRGITQSKDGKININLSNIPVAIRELAKLNQELNKIEDKDDKKAFKTSISNATDYLKLLQTIERKKAELNEIALSSRNIDKGVIASARNAINGIQQEISKQLFNIQNGSLINTAIMPEIKKLLSMSITEIGDYMRNLKKDNPLSVFANSADMLTSKIAAANKKILEMQALMRGSKVPGLFDTSALNGLRGVVGKMQSLINKEGKGEKTDINKINRLVSEYAKLVSQAELAKSTFKQLSREYDNANARLVSWFSKYRELQSIRNDRIRLGLDTSAIDAEISRVRALFSEINAIRTNLGRGNMDYLGMLGSRGTGVDTALYNSAVKAAREEIAERERLIRIRQKDEDEYNRRLERQARNVARLSAERERQNKKEADSALREEYRVRDAKLKTLEREAKARMRTQELADKAAADALKKQQRLDIETMQFQAMLNAAMERRMAAQREEAQLEAKKLSSMSSQEEIQRRFVSYMEQMNAMRPKNPLFNQSGMVDLQRVYGKAFDELGVQYDKLKAKIDSYHGPTDNAGFIAWKNELAVIEAKMQNLVTLSEQAARASVAGTYKPYTTTTKEEAQHRMQESNALKTAIQERMATEKRADEQRKEAEKQRRKDEKDAAAAEKQRQREIEISTRRAESLQRALARLRSAKYTSDSFGFDTRTAAVQISYLEAEMRRLYDILWKLQSADFKSALGVIGNTGNGRVVVGANYVASQYEKANRQAERGDAIEEKRKRKIYETGLQIQSSLVKGFKDANNAAGRLNSTIQDLKSLFLQGGLVFGAQQFAMSIIRTGGEMEKQHIAMQSILGDMQNANTMFNQTKELALQSPFTFSELNRDVKQLAAYGVEYEDLYDTTKRLADMASGLGVSFERIALAFGQVQARGWLDGKELRQIAYAGIPLLDRLSKYYSQREGKKVTTSDVKGRITNREVSFQDVKNIFWEMTDAGGQFYNMQLTLSETLLGRYNKLKDAWEIMLSDFARGDSIIGGTFKTILDSLTYIVQQMHTLGPVMAAAFTGFAIKKGITSLGSGGAASFLSNKANLADNAQAKLMQGQKLSQIEQQILLTKNRITNADLRSLIAYQNINKNELRRLYLSGAITKEQYKISLALMKQVGLTNAAAASTNKYALSWGKVGAAGMLALNGIGNAAKGLWAAIGGLPGVILTVLTMGVATLVSRYQDLTQKIKQTQDEIFDRRRQVADFTSQNNVAKAIASGEQKEIDNLIESYKEKLKELAPYDYSNLIMRAEEKKSHEERLKFLEQELKLIDEANKANSSRFADNGTWYEDLLGITGKGRDSYSGFMSVIKDIDKSASSYLLSQAKANAFGATKADQTMFNLNKSGFQNYALKVKEFISKEFGDISKDENLRRQATQAMNSIFSALGVSSENANLIRASILQAFGIYNDGWLSEEVGKRMSDLISERFPEIALKIKSDQSLNEGEKKKVAQLMNDAKNELISQYPVFSTTLQNLLDQSNFTAVVHLVTQSYGGVFNNLQKELAARIPQLQTGIQSDMFSLYSSKAETWGKENSWTAARNKANEEIKKAEEEYKNAKKSNAPDVNGKYTEYDRLKRIAKDLLNFDYDAENKKKNTGGNKEDEQLKRLRKRIELYKKFYSEYKKLQDLVGQGALDKLRKDGEFDPVFKYGLNNITDYESSVRQLLGAIPANTADRKDYKNQAIADIQTKNRELFSEQISKDNDELRTQLGIISEQYEVYKKMYKLTADSEGAMSIAFGGGMATKTYSEYLKGEMAKILPTHNKNTGLTYSLEKVLGMSQSQFDSAYGKNNSRLSVLFSQYQDELKKIKMETISMIADIIEKNSTLEQQLKDIDTEYEYQLGLLNEMKDLTPETRKRAEEGLVKTRDNKKAQVRFELFKQNSDWVAIFDDLDRVSTNTINSMIDKIDTFSKETGLSVEVVKQLRDALEKLRSKSIERNPLDALLNSTSRGNAIGNLIRDNKEYLDNGGNIIIDSAQAKKTGLKEGQSYTKTELENEQEAAYSGFPESLAALQKKFEALSSVLNPVLDLFSALGMEDTALGQGMGLASGAFSAASGVASGLNALGLSSLGPYGAAIGAGLSVVSGLFAMHDKALQKEIEASERRQKEMENMTKNIESGLESTLGGIYTYRASFDTQKTLKSVIKEYERDMRLWEAGGINRLAIKGTYTNDTYQQALKAQKSGTAYDAELASLMAQRDELKKQRQAEEDKKKTDADAIQNYDQQIKEMEQSIDDFAQTFLNDIYSIDIKSWASQLTDSIVEAWAKGEDAAEAYHDKVQELVKDLTKNILSQKIMEMALQPTLDELKDKLQQKGKLDEADIPGIADDLIKAGDNAVENITNILDALKEKGWDLSENGTLSVSNSIKSITEDTADILASYLNSIRLDCSVNRENLRLILVAVQSVPELNNIARSQLTQLTTLVTLAEARNSKLDDMYSWMNKVTNGVLKISMK